MERGIECRRRAWNPSDDDDRDSIVGTAYEGRRCLAHDPVAKRIRSSPGKNVMEEARFRRERWNVR